MQKKIIALAVAGLMSGAAFAQSNVTISGLVDMGYSYRSDNVASGVGSKGSFDSGVQSGSRIQFAGTEDLGNGLKAGFVLETGLNVDRGGLSNNGSTADRGFGRQSFLSLSGGFGTVAAGRMYSPQFTLLSSIDPFGAGTVGQANNIYTYDVRGDNVVAYVSPNFSGLTVVAAYSTDLSGQEAVDNAGDLRTWMLSPVYTNGPVKVGFNYHRAKANTSGAGTLKVWDLAGSYDLGVAKLAAMYGKRDNAGADRKHWMLGVTAPMGSGALLASYNRATLDGGAKGSQAAIGYQYNLSKRTNAYFVYSDISNKNGAAFAVGDSSNGGEGYQQGLNVGLRHKF
jgi:predicted porin